MIIRLFAIAQTTFREAIRQKILYVMLCFSVLLTCFSMFLGQLTLGAEVKMLKDMGLASIFLLGVLVAIFVGVNLLFKEIEKRTLFTILTKPVKRGELILGKFFGLIVTLALQTFLMSVVFFVLLSFYREPIDWNLLKCIVLIFMELCVLVAAALIFSSYSSMFMSILFCIAFLLVGHLTDDFIQILLTHIFRFANEAGEGFLYQLSQVAIFLLHVLESFSLDHFAINARIVHGVPVSWSWVMYSVFYGVCSCILLLFVAVKVFRRKDFQ